METDPVDALKALADENRLRALFALREGELCVCQLIELLGLAPSTVSKHLYILRQAGWVASRKEGRWIHYRLPARRDFPMIGKILTPLFQTLENAPSWRAYEKRVNKIRRMDVEKLCRLQNGR